MVFSNVDSGEGWVVFFSFGYDRKADWTGFKCITVADDFEEFISLYIYFTTPKLQPDKILILSTSSSPPSSCFMPLE